MSVNSNHPVTRDNKRNNDKLLLRCDIVLETVGGDAQGVGISTRTQHAQERGGKYANTAHTRKRRGCARTVFLSSL